MNRHARNNRSITCKEVFKSGEKLLGCQIRIEADVFEKS